MRAGLALAATTLVASPVFAANEEWPSGPKNEFFRALGRGWGKGQTRASRVNRGPGVAGCVRASSQRGLSAQAPALSEAVLLLVSSVRYWTDSIVFYLLFCNLIIRRSRRPRPEPQSREDIMRNSRTCFSRILIGAASLIAASTAALAGEQVLEFKLVTKAIDPKVVQASNIEGQTMSTSNAFGVAFFKDGRVAAKDFIVSTDLRKGSGPIRGYSTYTFDEALQSPRASPGNSRRAEPTVSIRSSPARAHTLTPRARAASTAFQRGSRAPVSITVSLM